MFVGGGEPSSMATLPERKTGIWISVWLGGWLMLGCCWGRVGVLGTPGAGVRRAGISACTRIGGFLGNKA